MQSRDTDYVVLENATFRGPAGPVFVNTNFRLPADERWAVRGASGSGKSLFVAAITGRLPLLSGSLRHPFLASDPRCIDSIYGVLPTRSIAVASMAEHRALMAGRAFHQLRWHASLSSNAATVADFLSLGEVENRNPFAVTTREEETRFLTAYAREAERFELSPLLGRPLVALSNGELHRLLIARALMLDPRLLIVDDPFAGIDAKTRDRWTALFAALPCAGTGVLHVAARDEDVAPDITHELGLEAGAVVYAGPRTTPLRHAAHREGSPTRISPCTGGTPHGSMGQAALELRHVTIRHGSVTLLDNVDWTIQPGERWALVGPNGAGKSTLLSLALADNPQAYANHVVVGGRRLGPGTSIWDVKRLVGWVSHELDVHYPLGTLAVEVVASGFHGSLGLHTTVAAAQRVAAARWLERLGLGGYAETAYGALSNLDRRLTLLARACVNEPLLLLLDEPCQGLDGAARRRFASTLESVLSQLPAALVYVSHEAAELPPTLDHVLELEGGRVVRRVSRLEQVRPFRPDPVVSPGSPG
jgi:molybdate transport system ATP-binding protein